MLDVELDKEARLAIVTPETALSEQDFSVIAGVIDPYLKEHGALIGLIICTKDFPGWESFAAMLKHFQFVRSHHQKLSHVALVTDSMIGDLAEKVAGHFISAQVKHFRYGQLAEARRWIQEAEAD